MRHLIGIAALLLFGSVQAAPLSYSWSGTITEVFVDLGTTVFSDTDVGDPFSGSWVYDSEPGDIVTDDEQTCDASLCEWEWTGAQNVGTLSALPNPVPGVFLIQENDQDLTEDPDDLDLINSILEPDIEVDTPFDLWELSSDLVDFDSLIFFGVTYITTDTSAIADASVYDAMPPFDLTPAAGRAAIFAIQEESASGSFFAFGTLTSVEIAPVPVPAALWLFGSALGLLGWGTRRARRLD
jgi:hypothetical protein